MELEEEKMSKGGRTLGIKMERRGKRGRILEIWKVGVEEGRQAGREVEREEKSLE